MGLLEAAIRVVAPPQCIGCGEEGYSLCPACSAAEIIPFGERCWNCNAISSSSRTCARCRQLGGPRSVYISTSYGGIAKELISVYKFGHQRAAAGSIARLMCGTFQEQMDEEVINKRDYLVVPVPTATSRVRERSFDHARLLARTIAAQLHLDYSPLLRRFGQSRQVGAGRSSRLNLPLGNYYLRQPGRVEGCYILLVDDVVTTGGTLIAAAKALKAAGAKQVDALAMTKRL